MTNIHKLSVSADSNTDFNKGEEAGLSEKIVYLAHGETYNFEIPTSRQQKISA